MMKPAVWTWEVPLYFWLGGIAAGSSLIGLACDVAGDHRSAAVARKLALGAVVPGAPLLILDLGRPERFFNMLRVFKPRSPMSMGAWCLMGFSTVAGTAVAADLTGREKPARALGGLTALLGTYLGSYTGALLASTAVPVWGRSRLFLGPIFVCTATATGAAANRLVLVATGMPVGHPTRNALGTIETLAMGGELAAVDDQREAPRPARAVARGGAARHAVPVGQVDGARRACAAPGPRARRAVGQPRLQRALPAGRPRLPLRLGRCGAHLGERRRGRRQDGAAAR